MSDFDRTLADDIIAHPNARVPGTDVVMTAPEIVRDLRTADRYVLDGRGVQVMHQLAAQDPKDILRLLKVAKPANPLTWIEWETWQLFDERERTDPGWHERMAVDRRKPGQRSGIFVLIRDDGSLHINAIEHQADSRLPLYWPLGFNLFIEPEDQAPDMATVCNVWGYEETADDLKVLARHGRFSAHPSYPLSERKLGSLAKQLSGFTRMTVAVLAMLNTIAEKSESTRPRRRFIAGGRTHPYVERRFLTVHVPKRVTDVTRWANREAVLYHKRLHQVRAHWRYLKDRPNTAGWEHVEIDGVDYWRKTIEAHLRGNADLGIVEHVEGAIVRGPCEERPAA